MTSNMDSADTTTVEDAGIEMAQPFMESDDKVQLQDQFEIPRQQANYVIEASVGPHDRPDVVLKAQQIQGRCYFEYGYVLGSALTDDGRLVPELDSARGEDGKTVATYLLARGVDKTIEEAGATMRMVDVGEQGAIEDLPTYKYFKHTFSSEVKRKLDNLVGLYGTQCVREIAALGARDRSDVLGSYELIRAATQNSIIKEASGACREKYLASLTEISLGPIIRFAGKGAVETLGEPVLVHAGDPRQKEVYVTPVLIDPNKALDGFIDEIEAAEKNADIVSLIRKIKFLTDGLSRDQISRRVTRILDKYS
jgi:hypothetical protein